MCMLITRLFGAALLAAASALGGLQAGVFQLRAPSLLSTILVGSNAACCPDVTHAEFFELLTGA